MTAHWQKKRRFEYGHAAVAVLLGSLAAGAVVSCVYDGDEPCGEGQMVYEDGIERCICKEGWASTEGGCAECGENEVAGLLGCACADGYGRQDPDATCEPCGDHEFTAPSGICECEAGYARATPADACEETTGDPENPAGGTPCTSDEECTDGARCDLDAATPTCLPRPVGLNESCASDADCAGFEATYCDTFVTQSCLVQGCTLSPDNCFPGTECCDLSIYGISQPLCLAEGDCAT